MIFPANETSIYFYGFSMANCERHNQMVILAAWKSWGFLGIPWDLHWCFGTCCHCMPLPHLPPVPWQCTDSSGPAARCRWISSTSETMSARNLSTLWQDFTSYFQVVAGCYPLVQVNKKLWLKSPCYYWVNQLFLWPCSSSQTVSHYHLLRGFTHENSMVMFTIVFC